MSSTWKNRLSVSIFGESHGAAIGVTLDGIPAGEKICTDTLGAFLQRRAPGRFPWTTPRKEADEPEFLSGIAHGVTCGSPITAIIRNTNIRPSDYANVTGKDGAGGAIIPRPGHADFAALMKHGKHANLSGGGHFSGRLTAALCIAGGICLQILEKRGISIAAQIVSIGGVQGDMPVHIEEIECAKQAHDSVGGIIECVATGVPAGLGSPMFGGMENKISQLVFAIPAVKGIEFGAGFGSAAMRGSENNDSFAASPHFSRGNASGAEHSLEAGRKVLTETNNHGGILGGITSGMPIVFRTAIKPTPSIGLPQQSVNFETGEPATIEVKGRHDPCIVPRAVPCMEAALAIAIYDEMI